MNSGNSDHNMNSSTANSSRYSFPYKMKKFVCASTSSQTEQNPPQSKKTSINQYENGDHVSNFYLNVCEKRENNFQRYSSSSDDDEVIFCEVRSKKRKKMTEAKKEIIDLHSDKQRISNRAMKFAQLDEAENLKYLIDEGLSVNTTDNFGWSLLMVASYAGSKNVVKYLISKGARRGKRDGKGNTALYLASKNNLMHIVNLLINKKKEDSEGNVDEEIIEIEESGAPFCEVCNMMPSCSQREHEASIAHLFRLGSTNMKPMYGIPRSNVGFQMLLQQGWNDSEGLGPEGVGRKYPIKANEKQDRLGLGHSSIEDGPENVPKGTTTEFRTSKYNNYSDKQKEKYFRRMLNEADF